MVVAADALIQLCRGRHGAGIQFSLECFDAGLILAQREVVLSLATVANHKEAVSIFAAIVTSQDKLTQRDAGRIFAPVKVYVAQAVECVEVGHTQAFARQDWPFLVWIVGQ